MPIDVFVVDNDETILVFMKKLLKKEGYSVKTAEDGLSALNVLKNYTPDVAFIDLIMPKIDGRKLCQIMKTMPKLSKTRLVMLSAVSKEERVMYTEMGFDACVAKGPLKQQGENVLHVLKLIASGEASAMPDGILGLENLYTREITSELLSSKRHHELIESNLTDGVLELTSDGSVVNANPAALRILGQAEENTLGHSFLSLLAVENRRLPAELLKSAQDREKTLPTLVDIDKRKVEMSCMSLNEDGGTTVIVILNDITRRVEAAAELRIAHDQLEARVEERTEELAMANKEIQESLQEKEILLREIHHRVKNNLQIVSSLLSLQASNSPDERTAQVFRQSMDRINSIGMVHEVLYQSQGLSGIDLGDYVQTVAKKLVESYTMEDRRIYLTVNSEPVFLDIDRAVPCGLIVNELITNSLKHAFPDGRQGTIRVLVQAGGASCRMVVQDNGVGLPSDFDSRRSMGMSIIEALVEQIGGTINTGSADGTRTTIDFPLI